MPARPVSLAGLVRLEAMPAAPVITIDALLLDAFIRCTLLMIQARFTFLLQREALMLRRSRVINTFAVVAKVCRTFGRLLAMSAFRSFREALILKCSRLINTFSMMAKVSRTFRRFCAKTTFWRFGEALML